MIWVCWSSLGPRASIDDNCGQKALGFPQQIFPQTNRWGFSTVDHWAVFRFSVRFFNRYMKCFIKRWNGFDSFIASWSNEGPKISIPNPDLHPLTIFLTYQCFPTQKKWQHVVKRQRQDKTKQGKTKTKKKTKQVADSTEFYYPVYALITTDLQLIVLEHSL